MLTHSQRRNLCGFTVSGIRYSSARGLRNARIAGEMCNAAMSRVTVVNRLRHWTRSGLRREASRPVSDISLEREDDSGECPGRVHHLGVRSSSEQEDGW